MHHRHSTESIDLKTEVTKLHKKQHFTAVTVFSFLLLSQYLLEDKPTFDDIKLASNHYAHHALIEEDICSKRYSLVQWLLALPEV